MVVLSIREFIFGDWIDSANPGPKTRIYLSLHTIKSRLMDAVGIFILCLRRRYHLYLTMKARNISKVNGKTFFILAETRFSSNFIIHQQAFELS